MISRLGTQERERLSRVRCLQPSHKIIRPRLTRLQLQIRFLDDPCPQHFLARQGAFFEQPFGALSAANPPRLHMPEPLADRAFLLVGHVRPRQRVRFLAGHGRVEPCSRLGVVGG